MKARLCFVLAIGVSVISCAHSPKMLEPSATVSLATVDELKRAFGSDFTVNPYLEPIGMITGRTTEFAVFRFDLVLSESKLVTLDARLLDSTRSVIARAVDLENMTLFWSLYEGEDSETGKRRTALERSYAPGFSFSVKPGKRTFYLVVKGKYPFPRPAIAEAYLSVDGLLPVQYEAPLSEPPSKRK